MGEHMKYLVRFIIVFVLLGAFFSCATMKDVRSYVDSEINHTMGRMESMMPKNIKWVKIKYPFACRDDELYTEVGYVHINIGKWDTLTVLTNTFEKPVEILLINYKFYPWLCLDPGRWHIQEDWYRFLSSESHGAINVPGKREGVVNPSLSLQELGDGFEGDCTLLFLTRNNRDRIPSGLEILAGIYITEYDK
jgi:hypothetical protein